MRPIEIKYYSYTINTISIVKSIQVKYVSIIEKSSHKNRNRKKQSQFSIIFVLCKVDPPPRAAPWAKFFTAK